MVAGRPAQAVRRCLSAQDEVHRRERDVHGGPGGDERAGHERGRRVESPEARPAAGVDRLPGHRRDGRSSDMPSNMARFG